jgi:D-amino-acid oxidase
VMRAIKAWQRGSPCSGVRSESCLIQLMRTGVEQKYPLFLVDSLQLIAHHSGNSESWEARVRYAEFDRRSFIRRGSPALAGAAIPLGNWAGRLTAGQPQEVPTLPRVDVVASRITRQIAGLRPFRPSGFVVRSERLGEKLVMHNYGHGGCGVTLSWGTADMVAKSALATPHRRAAVIGCGAIGLTTARLLQDRGFEVAIYAKDLPPNTTSNIAAAMFGVTSIVDEAHHDGPFIAQLKEAVRFAHRYFQHFIGQRYGVHWVEMYLIGDDPQTQPWDFSISPLTPRIFSRPIADFIGNVRVRWF